MIGKKGEGLTVRSESSTNPLISSEKVGDKSTENDRRESDQFALNAPSALRRAESPRRRKEFSLAAPHECALIAANREPVREPETWALESRRRHKRAASSLHDNVVVDEPAALQSRVLPDAIASPSKRPSGARPALCRTSSRSRKSARLRPNCLLLAGFVVFCSKLLLPLAFETETADSLWKKPDNHSSATSFGQKLAFDELARPKRAAPNLSVVGGSEHSSSRAGDQSTLVQTKHGLFRGTLLASGRDVDGQPASNRQGDINDANVVGFLGIRYASAPIKRLRFMPPTAYHYTPNQVHSMQKLGPICRQRWPVEPGLLSTRQHQAQGGSEQSTGAGAGGGQQPSEQSWTNWQDSHLLLMRRMVPRQSFLHLRPLFRRLAGMEQSEDCLNLNIYVPSEAIPSVANQHRDQQQPGTPAPTLRPVLIIIHGDSFDFGAGSAVDALKFVQLNRVLAVTFNYRLNILGFPPKLAGASRGNLGLMDQVAALHWIKDNIGSFGGAASNITLMGTKRGAIFVNLLMLSPLARGLFQRAIMEDGSALTPLIANQIGSPLASSTLLGGPLQSGNSLAAHYLRLLAKLCDCPVYLRPAAAAAAASSASSSPASNATASSAASGGGAASAATGAPAASLAQQQLSGFADETKANALTFECLRQKPVEQIMQRVPLDLLQFNQVSGEITIAQRFLNRGPLAAASPNSLEQQQQPPSTPPSANLLADPQQQQQPFSSSPALLDSMGALDSVQLGRLVELVTREQLERQRANVKKEAAGTRGSPVGYSSTTINKPASGQPDWALVSEQLFGAIYGQPSASVRQLFAPVIDGTIVPDEDIASNMMKAGSLFGQRDLLIGLSQKILSGPTNQPQTTRLDGDKDERQQQQQQSAPTRSSGEAPLELGPDHLMAERITEQVEQLGLSSEQAIELVNSFVRSLYRHHNQEISNSIVNNYLVQSAGASRRATSVRKQFKQQPADEQLVDEIQAKISQQQLLALDSLLEAFHDALTNVPVLKTALIHATRQLDSLVDAFVGQQFEKWKQTHWPVDGNDSSPSSGRGASGSSSSLMLPDQSQLLDSFIAFAQSLFNDPGWPLKLQGPSNADVQQARATYLFQFDSGVLIREVQSSINRLVAARSGLSYSSGWRELKETLSGLLVRLQSGQQFGDGSGRRLGIGCGLELGTGWPTEYELPESPEAKRHQHYHLWARLNDWLCTRLTRTLGNFVASGNVNENSHSQSALAAANNNNQEQQSIISERVARFENRCNSVNQLAISAPADHHSVQAANFAVDAAAQSTESAAGAASREQQQQRETPAIRAHDSECRRELDSIALDYLVGGDNYHSQDHQDQQQNRWRVFNLFTQQIATLPSSAMRHSWLVNEIGDGGQAMFHDPKSSLSARSSFWANFIPALNCSRTQPIIPSSFMLGNRPLAGVYNSSGLLGLNLLFNCQTGSRSALDAIESLASNINQQLQARAGDWRLGRASVAQNHHTLRMANMSQSSSIEENIEQQEPIDEQNGNANKASTSGAPSDGRTAGGDAGGQQQDGQRQIARTVSHPEDLRSKYIGILVVVCGLVISLSLASGACAVMRQRSQQQQTKQRQKTTRKSLSSLPAANNNSNQAPLENSLSSNGFGVNADDAHDAEQQVLVDQILHNSTGAHSPNASSALCEQRQQQTSFSDAGFNELSLESQIKTQEDNSTRRTSGQISTGCLPGPQQQLQQEQQLPSASTSFSNSKSVCMVQQHLPVDDSSHTGSLVFWNQPDTLVGGRGLLLDASGCQQQVTLCRSHSSLDATLDGLHSTVNNQSLFAGEGGESATIARLSRVQVPSPSDRQLAGSSAVAVRRQHQSYSQQPILLPLLTNSISEFNREQQQRRQPFGANGPSCGMNHHLRHQHGLLTQGVNGGHYGGSSSETTQATQSSSGSPSVAAIARVCGSTSARRTSASPMFTGATTVASKKKRVKISDPVSATMDHSAKRAAKQQKYININNSLLDNQNNQQALASRGANFESQLSLESSAPNYCPVHRKLQHQQQQIGSSLEVGQTNYLFNDAFLAANLCDDSRTLLDRQLASISSNCEHFSSDNTSTTPMGSYFDSRAPQQLNPQLYHYAPSSSQVDLAPALTGVMVSELNQNQHDRSLG